MFNDGTFDLHQVPGTRYGNYSFKVGRIRHFKGTRIMSKSVQEVSPAPNGVSTRVKNIALFLASPFIGLVYAVLLPGKLFKLAMADLKANAAEKDASN